MRVAGCLLVQGRGGTSGNCWTLRARLYLPLMSVAQEIPVMITCPNQHELWVKVATSTPPQPQPVRCPLCDEAQDVLLPRITKVEVL